MKKRRMSNTALALSLICILSVALLNCGGGGGGGNPPPPPPPQAHAPSATGYNRPLYAGTSPAFTPWVDDPFIWDTFTYLTLTQPVNGTATIVGNKLVFSPHIGFTSGSDNFTYSATDQAGDTVTGTATVRVYDSTSLSYCTQDSTLSSGYIYWYTRTNANLCAFYSESTTRVDDTGTPVTMDYFINWPANGSTPKALVFLIGGGDLNMFLSGNPSTGIATYTSGGGNFIVRTAQLFAEAGYATVAMDRPTDQPPPGSTNIVADIDQYRVSVKHAVDILTVLKHVNTENLDVFLAGTSRGTISAVAANLIAAGLSLSSPLTSETDPDRLYIGIPGTAQLQTGFVQRPVHVLWHQDDECSLTTPTDAQTLYTNLSSSTTASYNIASGGVAETGADVCGAFHYHGYLGMETTAVGYITSWLDARVAAFAGNKRPEAAFATVATASGVPLQTDLALLTRDQDGDTLSYALSHAASSLGGSVSLSGSTATYTPPAGVSNKTDYYVYVASDGNGGVGAAVITIEIGN